MECRNSLCDIGASLVDLAVTEASPRRFYILRARRGVPTPRPRLIRADHIQITAKNLRAHTVSAFPELDPRNGPYGRWRRFLAARGGNPRSGPLGQERFPGRGVRQGASGTCRIAKRPSRRSTVAAVSAGRRGWQQSRSGRCGSGALVMAWRSSGWRCSGLPKADARTWPHPLDKPAVRRLSSGLPASGDAR